MSEESKDADKRERLSALMDGQAMPRQVGPGIDALLNDSELQRAWSRYWLISDALKQNLPGTVGSELYERVKQSVSAEAEPSQWKPRARAGRWSARGPAIGLALAASVAVVGLLGVLTFGDRTVEKRETVVARLEPTVIRERPTRMRWDIGQPRVEERLNSYLVNHSEHESGVRGMLSYARVVGYDGRD